jgi:putative oxidoreductase
MLQKLLSPSRWSAAATDRASLILRVAFGLLMLQHGYPKLQQLMAGGEIKFPDPLGIGSYASLVLVTFAEFFCAILVVLGLWTRLALIPLMIAMFVAAMVFHAKDPIGDKESSLSYLILYYVLFLLGSGRYSLDMFLRKDKEV